MKYLLSFILFTIALTAFSKSDLHAIIKDDQVNLAYGVKIPEYKRFNDFSDIKIIKPATSTNLINCPLFLSDEVANSWYWHDFASDPFDGRIEVLVMGEPSASTTTTLIISMLFGALLLSRKYQTIRKTI